MPKLDPQAWKNLSPAMQEIGEIIRLRAKGIIGAAEAIHDTAQVFPRLTADEIAVLSLAIEYTKVG